jgi:hypothetical protein
MAIAGKMTNRAKQGLFNPVIHKKGSNRVAQIKKHLANNMLSA